MEAVLNFKVDRLEEQIDTYWRQRSHLAWLEKGDRNTSYFHKACTERRRRNKIGRLKKENGEWAIEEGEKMELILNYFRNIFTAGEEAPLEEMQQLLQAVQPKVTSEMNEMLMGGVSR
jgi:hypothetical protein